MSQRDRAFLSRPAVLSGLLAVAALQVGYASQVMPSEGNVRFAAEGRIEGASRPVDLAFTISGRVLKAPVEAGTHVHKGELLAELECTVERAQWKAADAAAQAEEQGYARARRGARLEERAEAAARVDAALADFKDAQTDYARFQDLVKQGNLASRQDLDRARRRLDMAQANLQVAQRARDLTDAKLLPEEDARWRAEVLEGREQAQAAADRVEQCAIYSPIDGVLLRRHVIPGDVVSILVPSPALTVVDTSPLRVRAELDERDALSIRLGEGAEIAVPDTPSDSYLGSVTWISPIMGRKTVRSTDIAEKSDRDVREVLVTLVSDYPALPIGLRVVVRFSGQLTRFETNRH